MFCEKAVKYKFNTTNSLFNKFADQQVYYRETLAEAFSCEFCEIFKSSFFYWDFGCFCTFLFFFFQYTSGCLLLSKKYTVRTLKKIKIYFTLFYSDYILLFTTSVLETFSNSIQFAINRRHVTLSFRVMSASVEYKFRVTFIKNSGECQKTKS